MREPPSIKQAAFMPWQQSLLTQLTQQKKNQHLAHGIILHTDQSSDLTSLLWQLSSDLLCADDSSLLHCGQCKSCQLMQANSFPDMLWVTKEYNEKKKKINRDINVDQIRTLIHQLSLTNQYDTLKIALIYPAESLNRNAANSLLKTLEEPESDTLIILATHKIGRLPITIRSRCQQYKIPQADKQQSLAYCEPHNIDEQTINTLVQQGISDPVSIVNLMQQDYLELQKQCEAKTLRYISSDPQQELVALSSDLAALPLPFLRLIINGLIDKLIRFHLKVFSQSSMHQVFQKQSSAYSRELYKVKNKIQKQMMFEENNLNVQLQINDVLISLKNIFSQAV